MKQIFTYIIFLTALVLCRCTGNNLAGAGSETTNSLTGIITTAAGTPVPNASVKLIPFTYDVVKDSAFTPLLTTTTNAEGKYSFSRISRDTYNIQVKHTVEKTSAIINSIAIGKDPVVAPVAKLLPSGSIKVTLSDSFDLDQGYVYIPGTTLFALLKNAKGFVMLDSVPAGIMPSLCYSSINGLSQKVLQTDVAVYAEETTSVSLLQKKLYLNTTANGANILGTVTNFPVLVRLTKGNFNFQNAQKDGSDLQFTKSDKTQLAYEIERWDPTLGVAEIWVKVDTVLGNDSLQFMIMSWGKVPVSATALSNNAVFDTANGFDGAWHLGANCFDASPNKNDGISYGVTDTLGIIGNAKKFKGTDSIKINGLMGKPANVTLSAWARLDSARGPGSEVLSIGNFVLLRMDDSFEGRGTQGSFCMVGDSVFSVLTSGKYFAKTGWHYLAYSYDAKASLQSLYVDGQLLGTKNNATPINYTTGGAATFIGTHGNSQANHGFVGIIDEARICKESRSADWIKLCYMNQQINDKLIVYK